MESLKNKNLTNIKDRADRINHIINLSNLENRFFKLYMTSEMQIFQQKKIANKFEILNIIQKLNSK